jgi:hypothetical protein
MIILWWCKKNLKKYNFDIILVEKHPPSKYQTSILYIYIYIYIYIKQVGVAFKKIYIKRKLI